MSVATPEAPAAMVPVNVDKETVWQIILTLWYSRPAFLDDRFGHIPLILQKFDTDGELADRLAEHLLPIPESVKWWTSLTTVASEVGVALSAISHLLTKSKRADLLERYLTILLKKGNPEGAVVVAQCYGRTLTEAELWPAIEKKIDRQTSDFDKTEAFVRRHLSAQAVRRVRDLIDRRKRFYDSLD